jgi:hypothetical protein
MAYDHWNTPEWIVERLHKIAPIDLDPCSNPTSKVKAKKAIQPPRDGLQAQWKGHVYLNTPFSNIYPWVQKGFVLSRFGEHDLQHVTYLIPFSPETQYWKLIWNSPDYLSRRKGAKTVIGTFPSRIHFNDPRNLVRKENPRLSIALVYYGLEPEKCVQAFGDVCRFITSWSCVGLVDQGD